MNGGSNCRKMPTAIRISGLRAACGANRMAKSKRQCAATGRRCGLSQTIIGPITSRDWPYDRWGGLTGRKGSPVGPICSRTSITKSTRCIPKASRARGCQRSLKGWEELGRYWEAWAWNVALVKAGTQEAGATRDRLKKILDTADHPQTINRFNPALQVDLSHFPLPDWSVGQPLEHGQAASSISEVQASFVESTQTAGIDFSYFNGDDLESKGMKIHQTLGGGIAVIDYDGDGWPDLHFTQGAREAMIDADADHVDRLYRNLGNGRFTDVTFAAGVADDRYSQGATVGDYDNDGFPDLFISNIGKSRLYRNNGDGTFADVTVAAGIALNHWSTSSLLADLNGDGFPDLFDVTYIRGTDVFQLMCGEDLAVPVLPRVSTARMTICSKPGDGTFRDVSDEAGVGDHRQGTGDRGSRFRTLRPAQPGHCPRHRNKFLSGV